MVGIGHATPTTLISLEEVPVSRLAKLPVPPGLTLEKRFQQLESEVTAGDEEIGAELGSFRGPGSASWSQYEKVANNEDKHGLNNFQELDAPSQMMPSINPMTAEFVELDVHLLVSDRWCKTDRRTGCEKVAAIMDTGASDSRAFPPLGCFGFEAGVFGVTGFIK